MAAAQAPAMHLPAPSGTTAPAHGSSGEAIEDIGRIVEATRATQITQTDDAEGTAHCGGHAARGARADPHAVRPLARRRTPATGSAAALR